MPADLWTDAARMAGCGLMIAAVAVPLGLAAWFNSRQPILLRSAHWPVPWTGFELLLLFPFAAVLPMALVDPLLNASGFYRAVYGQDAIEDVWKPMRPLWSSAFFTPCFIALLWLAVKAAYPSWRPPAAATAPRVAAGVGTWLALHPLVAAIHFAVVAVFAAQAWELDSHPLEKAFHDGRPPLDQTLLLVQAAIVAPLIEEVMFRGALLPWLLGKRYRPVLTMGIAAGIGVALSIQNEFKLAPAIFTAILLAGGAVLHFTLKRHRRTVGAIYVSAAFFAFVHNSVWPSPIPLFALGLGLGWLAVRTRGILAPAIVHGLFNAVSVLFVLRS